MSKQPVDLGVRIIRDSGLTAARVGRIIFPPAMLREQLVRRGLAEEVKPELPSPASVVKR